MYNARRRDTQILAVRKNRQQNSKCDQGCCAHALKVCAKRPMKPKPPRPPVWIYPREPNPSSLRKQKASETR